MNEEKEAMQKPSSVAADELKQGIIYLCNNSGLPAFVISLIMDNLANEVREISKAEFTQESKDWNDYCEREKDIEI